MKCHSLVVFILFSLFLNGSSLSRKVLSEKSILLECKTSVSDPSGILSSWNSNHPDHCSGFGVSCNLNSRVSSLSITDGGGRGVSGGGYRSNSSLALSCSQFAEFPFYDFGNRRTCSNDSAKLVGNLLPLIRKLAKLRVLSLPCNVFTGEIPAVIWGLERLEVLDVEGNSLTGKLLVTFRGFRKLRVLNLGFNRIEGRIPISLSKCVTLEVLNLAGNKMIESIPEFFSRFLRLFSNM